MMNKKMSKYQRKLQRRSRLSKLLGLPPKSPMPVIWQAQYYDKYVAPKEEVSDVHATHQQHE